MEARIYAEDPERGFVPSSGTIRALSFPEGKQIRVDQGVDAGDRVSVHYDPMIAKLIVHGPDRETCRQHLLEALSASFIAGPTTNLGFLQALAELDAFRDGRLDTGLLDREPERLLKPEPPPQVLAAASAFWLLVDEQAAVGPSPWSRCDGWRVGESASRSLEIECGATRVEVEARGTGGSYELKHSGQAQHVVFGRLDESRALLEQHGQSTPLWIHSHSDDRLDICWRHQRWSVIRHPRFEAAQSSSGGDGDVLAPMPGKVLDIRIANGDQVREGDTIIIMEAMKMELTIKAPMDGTLENLAISTDELVEADMLLLSVKPGSAA
jgi:3-methylcrotonyl-CoA carboxylase alpha subunit